MVIRTAGTNCDLEMVRAFELAGAPCDLVHMDRLIADPAAIARYDLIGVAGGFSYGDDIAAGRAQAMRMRHRLWDALRDAAARGVPMIGACNGFQVMVQLGLLPGPADGEPWPDRPPTPVCALADNDGDRFEDRWTRVEVPANTRCVWTRGLGDRFGEETMLLPSAHGEGRFVAGDPSLIDDLERTGRVAVRYAEGENFNGSDGRIAGVCDASGLILGLMPHPERYLSWAAHPWATRLTADVRTGDTPGLAMFRSAVAAVVAGGSPVAG